VKIDQSPMLNVSIPNAFDINFERRRATKDHTTVSTTMSSLDKKNLESRKKPLFDVKTDNMYTPTNLSSINGPESLHNTPSNPLF